VFNLGGAQNANGTWTGLASLQFVTVGDPGNAPDTTGYGSVPYTYQMGEYDVTVGQYCQFHTPRRAGAARGAHPSQDLRTPEVAMQPLRRRLYT
jgi:hypothetical protein